MKIFNWTTRPEKLAAWNKQVKRVDKYGNQYWYKNGLIHRGGDQPAIIRTNSEQLWYRNGQLHRDGDKPAIIDAEGGQIWYNNDFLHRDGDKPAEIYSNGSQRWWKNGLQVARTQQEFNQWKARQNST